MSPGHASVGYSSDMGYWFALYEHNDHRADDYSEKGQYVNVLDFMAKTALAIDWDRVPKFVIRSLYNEGDFREQEAARRIAAALSG